MISVREVIEHFHHPQKTGHAFAVPRSHPKPQATKNPLLSVSHELLFLDISYKWNHRVRGLSWLAAFIKRDILKFTHIAAWARFIAE